jgi:hypothetical protein
LLCGRIAKDVEFDFGTTDVDASVEFNALS